MRKSYVTEIIAISFIFLFIYAATSKLLEFQKFKVQLGQSPMLTHVASWIAPGIPLIEILITLTLAFQKTRLFGLYASFTLMTLFSCYIVAITKFSDYIPCSCGGILQKMSWDQHLIFNIFFMAIAVAGILLTQMKMKNNYIPDIINQTV